MNEILNEMIKEQNGYIRLIDAQRRGVSKYTALDYIRRNEMERVAPGVYLSEEAWEDRLYFLQLRNRKIIFSHETALYLHGLSDREPFAPVISVVRGYNAKHLKEGGTMIHTVRSKWFEIGLIEAKTFAGNTVRVYDKERTVCDIIKIKKKIDIQIFQTALSSFFSDQSKDIHKLFEYAREMKMEDKVRQYTEVLL